MTHPGRFLALVLLASVTSLALIYHFFGFSSAPRVLAPGVDQEVDLRLKPVMPIEEEPTILEPTDNAGSSTLGGNAAPQRPTDDAYPDVGGIEFEPRREVVPLDSRTSGSVAESADERGAPFELVD